MNSKPILTKLIIMPWRFCYLLHFVFFTLCPLDVLVTTLIMFRMVHGKEKVITGTEMGHRLYLYGCMSLFYFTILRFNLSKTLLAINKRKAQSFSSGIRFLWSIKGNPLLMLIKFRRVLVVQLPLAGHKLSGP